jgi:hypothetical protein
LLRLWGFRLLLLLVVKEIPRLLLVNIESNKSLDQCKVSFCDAVLVKMRIFTLFVLSFDVCWWFVCWFLSVWISFRVICNWFALGVVLFWM